MTSTPHSAGGTETGCTSFCLEADAVYPANIWYELLGNRTLLVKVTKSIEEEQVPGLEQENNALRYALCVPCGSILSIPYRARCFVVTSGDFTIIGTRTGHHTKVI